MSHHRVERAVQQITSNNTSNVTFDPFSPQVLRSLASKNHYGDLTPDVVKELIACVSNPKEQCIIDTKLIEFVKTNKLANPNILDDETTLSQSIAPRFSHDRSHFDAIPALCVIAPDNEAEVQKIMKVCNKYKIPVHPSGARTGLEGGSLPIIPGVTLDMTRMCNIVELIESEQLVVVEPGVEKLKLQKWLKERGYFLRVDPGSAARMGGYANTNASGTYIDSNMQKFVRTMNVVTAQGDIMKTRSRSPKTSAGYNLQGIIIGSEGTLCVVTQITLKVCPIPPVILSARMQFPTTKHVTSFTSAMLQSGYPALVRAELLNEEAVSAVNAYSNTTFDVKPTLLLECHLTDKSEVAAHEALIKRVATQHSYLNYVATASDEEYEQIWSARKDALFAALKAYKPPTHYTLPPDHKKKVTIFVTDVCVPIPYLPEIIDATEKDFAQHHLGTCAVGHVGDGNFHMLSSYDANDPQQVKAITECNARMLRKAISLGGTITGEHGVGMGKMWALEEERGPVAMKMMRDIKLALDPNCIMNPFKVFTPYTCENTTCNHKKTCV